MNRAALEAWFKAHRLPVLAGAGGLVVLLALRAKKSSGTKSGGSGALAGNAASPQYTGQAGAAYDSSANDAYNALEPQISALATAVSALQNPAPGASPTPVTANPSPAPNPRHNPIPSPRPGTPPPLQAVRSYPSGR